MHVEFAELDKLKNKFDELDKLHKLNSKFDELDKLYAEFHVKFDK